MLLSPQTLLKAVSRAHVIVLVVLVSTGVGPEKEEEGYWIDSFSVKIMNYSLLV